MIIHLSLGIKLYIRGGNHSNMFSIIIPTWNNLTYLRLCVESIRANSAEQHEIVLHINEGADGTCEWAREQGINYTFSEKNIGICTAVNQAAALASGEYIVYMNDDMYVCPDWDKVLLDRIASFGNDCFMISATMIEPRDTGNPCVIVANYGTNLETFDAQRLKQEVARLDKEDWNGSAWPPTLVHRRFWHLVGGYSVEFSPGMSSDDDFAMKMWLLGCRQFVGVGAARVYHFQAKSTGRITKNDGRRQFLMKWGISQSTFNRLFLRRGTRYHGPLSEPDRSKLRMEQFRAALKRKFL
jgi:glycosyltransferase involved in cell wall biosynthesis